MQIVYRSLFRIRVRHGWYPEGEIDRDFEIRPTAATSDLCAVLGLRTRAYADGLAVFAEVEPDTDPPVLLRPVGERSIRLTFELRALNPLLLGAADLPPYSAAREVFCFDNLREDEEDGRLHLGDSVADARIGEPVSLLTGGIHTHAFAAATLSATITVTDRFGAVVAAIEAESADAVTPMSDYRLDLSAIDAIRPGRYEVADDQGNAASIYYDPDLSASRPVGVIEIYSHTASLTPDASDRVPDAYRYLDGDELTGIGAYAIQFDARATTWRYIVTKKYDNNSIALEDLSIDGPVAFGGAVSGTRAVFTSSSAVTLSAARRGLQLLKDGAQPVRELPEPGLATPLGRGATPTDFVSDMFVYV
jgi:hypothetical protein